jgi:hypothetical protein
LAEGGNSGHFTVGLRSNDLGDGFQVISKGAATTPETDPYTNLCFEVKANGNVTAAGNVGIANPTPLGRLDIGGTTASNVQGVFTRGVDDPNFQIRAINGVSGATAGTLVGEFGLVYAGTGDAATINFYRGAGTQDASLGINTNNVERLKIDASGRVTMPAQPAFLAQSVSGASTTPTEIIWAQTIQFNIGSCYSSANGRFTAPVAGTYFFRTHILTSNAPAGEIRVALCKNGSAYGGATTILVKPASTWNTVHVTSHMYLAAGDYASVILTQLPATGALHTDANFNSFSGHLIG